MSKKPTILMFLISIMLLVSACSGGSGNAPQTSQPNKETATESTQPAEQKPEQQDTAQQSVDRLTISGGNNGFPSPFTFSSSGPFGYLRNSMIFDTLTWKDDTGIIPWLAKSWEVSEDGKTYTFKLEESVKWHDGEPLSADDVVFSFEYYKKHPFNWNGDIAQIKSVDKTDETTVVFQLNSSYAPMLSDLVGIVPIIPKHIWEQVADPQTFKEDQALVGTGPFKLDEYDAASGQYLYKANEQFFKGDVLVKELAFTAASDKLLALQNGEIDATYTTSYSDVQTMEAAGFKSIKSEPTGSVVRISFNMDHMQLGDKKLRQAIAYALDRVDISAKITGGEPMAGSAGVVPPDSPWYNKEVKQYPYNVAESERLLDELGYVKNDKGIREGLKLSLMTSSSMQDSVMMQEMLKKVGIELQLVQLDSAAFAVALGENNYDMAITGHIGASGDPDFLRLWFSGKASNMWSSRGKNLELGQFHELAEQQMQETNESKRKEIINSMQNILADELPTLVLYHRPFYHIHNPKKFDNWKNTYGGIADGMPLWENKVYMIDVKKQ